MPIHLTPSRRRFIQTVSGAAAVLTVGAMEHPINADERTEVKNRDVDPSSVDPNSWVFLSDTHIAADKTRIAHGANMFANLSRAIDEVLQLTPVPAGVMVNGDCAYLKGLPEDYAVCVPEISRLNDAGIPVHMTMGNHDDRDQFFTAFNVDRRAVPMKNKHVSVIQTPLVNFFLVDSLQIVDKVTGEIGAEQRAWLAESLTRHADRPAVVVGHHNPQYLPEGSKETVTGLADTAELIDLFHAHPQVKAYFYGHTHQWQHKQTAGKVHLVNLPPVAYLFQAEKPNGWVHAKVSDAGMQLTLHAFDQNHAENGQTLDLTWK